MLWRKKLLKESNLYLILDRDVNSYEELFEIVKQSLAAGVDVFQIRDKRGAPRDIIGFTNKATKLIQKRALFIINDHVDVAIASSADGVHLGQGDVPIKTARRILGGNAIIGLSCQTEAHVKEAQREDIDYIGFGSVYKTLTKPNRKKMNLQLLRRVVTKNKVPIFAIGGINSKNLENLLKIGVKRVAVCRDVCQARDVSKNTRILKFKLNAADKLRG